MDTTTKLSLNDFWLTDESGTTVKFKLTTPLSFGVSTYPRGALQTQVGRSTYSDLTPPHNEENQQTAEGGRGATRFSLDRTQYFDGDGVLAQVPDQVILQGLEHWAHVDQPVNMPGDVKWVSLLDDEAFIGDEFTTGDTYLFSGGVIIARKIGTPVGNLAVRIKNESGGLPTTNVVTSSLAPGDWERNDDFSTYYTYEFTPTSKAAANYFLVVNSTSGADDANNCWQIACATSGQNIVKSSDGSTWVAGTNAPYYALKEEQSGFTYSSHHPFAGHYSVRYKGQVWRVITEPGSNSALYQHGWRGVAQSNSLDKSKLNDTAITAAVAADSVGGYVVITAGAGSEEAVPYRKITAAAAGEFTVSPDWNTTHDTTTEYVVYGVNFVTSAVPDIGGIATGAPAVVGDFMYIPMGQSGFLYRFLWYNNGGTATTATGSEAIYADHVAAVQDQFTGRYRLWGAENQNAALGVTGFVADNTDYLGYDVPLHRRIGEIAPTDRPWNARVITNITNGTVAGTGNTNINVGAGFTTGVIASHNLDEPTNLSQVDAFMFKVYSTVAMSANDLELRFNGRQDGDIPGFIPDALTLEQPTVPFKPDMVAWRKRTAPPTDAFFYDDSATTKFERIDNFLVQDDDKRFRLNYGQTLDEVYLGAEDRFDVIQWHLQSQGQQAQTAAPTIKYWRGDSWQTVGAVTDSTDAAGATLDDDGSYSYTMPGQWDKGSDDSTLDNTLYWVQITFNAALDAVVVNNVHVGETAREFREWYTLPDTVDGLDVDGAERISWFQDDKLYIISDKQFNRVRFKTGSTVNSAASVTASMKYFDGDAFTAVDNFSDGTVSGGTTLGATSGVMSFNVDESDWQTITLNGITGYAVEISVDGDLTPSIDLVEVTLEDRYFNPTQSFSLDQAKDGHSASFERFVFDTDNFVFIAGMDRFSLAHFVIQTGNGTSNDLTVDYWDGKQWTAATVTDTTESGGASLGATGDVYYTNGVPEDWEPLSINGVSAYWWRLSVDVKSSVIELTDVWLESEAVYTVSNPTAIPANEWATVYATVVSGSGKRTLLNSVRNVSLALATDLGAQTITLQDGIQGIKTGAEYFQVGDRYHRINLVVPYGEQAAEPWYLKANIPFRVDTTSGKPKAIQMRLNDLEALTSSLNGRAATGSDVYLYLNVGASIFRYVAGALQEIGHTTGTGLPTDRQGEVVKLVPYAGRVLALVDAGDSGYSTVQDIYGGTPHEFWRLPKGYRPSDMWTESVPGADWDRLYVAFGNKFWVWIPLPKSSLNPLYIEDFPYRWEGHWIMAWVDADWADVPKLWTDIRVYSENLSAGSQEIELSFRFDTTPVQKVEDDVGWITPTDYVFDTSPRDTLNIVDGSGKFTYQKVRFMPRLKLTTNDRTVTPVVKALVIQSLLKVRPKLQVNATVEDGDIVRRHGWVPSNQDQAGDTEWDQVLTWLRDPDLLTIGTNNKLLDGLKVTLNDVAAAPRKMEQYGHGPIKELYANELVMLEV